MVLTSRCSVNAYACSDFNFCSIVCIKKELSLKLFSKASICISGLTDVTRKLFVYLLKKKKRPTCFCRLEFKDGLILLFLPPFLCGVGGGGRRRKGEGRGDKKRKRAFCRVVAIRGSLFSLAV